MHNNAFITFTTLSLSIIADSCHSTAIVWPVTSYRRQSGKNHTAVTSK